MKNLLLPVLFLFSLSLLAQKHIYEIHLFGKKIGQTIVERIDKGNGEVQFKLQSKSDVNILFTHKTSVMNTEVNYKDGKMISSYCKNVKDGVIEIVSVAWNGTKYLIKKGEEVLQLNQVLDFSSIQLYYVEPTGKTKIFSERIGQICSFVKTAEGEYECKLANGITNIYRYKKGVLYELEMSKGASVFMKLVP
ncbi:MAG: hypothetical protein NTY88_09100 [Bacteroidetes bacterium]|nr:hypothetical protein [Bacteroidota bacterium]